MRVLQMRSQLLALLLSRASTESLFLRVSAVGGGGWLDSVSHLAATPYTISRYLTISKHFARGVYSYRLAFGIIGWSIGWPYSLDRTMI